MTSYEHLRSWRHKNINLIYIANDWQRVPFEIRCLGTWQNLHSGCVENLNPSIRKDVEWHGYALRMFRLTSFDPENPVTQIGLHTQ